MTFPKERKQHFDNHDPVEKEKLKIKLKQEKTTRMMSYKWVRKTVILFTADGLAEDRGRGQFTQARRQST